MSPFELISTDPVTGAVVWRGPIASAAAVDTAATRARRAAADWAWRPQAERDAIALRFAELVRNSSDAFARLISEETGKPFWEAKTEVASVAGKIDISMTMQAERAGARLTPAGGVMQALRHKPLGVLAVLGPYNFPAHLPNGHIAPALLAGNAVLFKPSELTPAAGLYLADLWRQAGVPSGVLQVLPGGADTGRALAGHAEVDGVLFTGSAQAGLALHRQFAGQPQKLLALEMGGNNPLIVWDVADLDAAAHVIVQSAYLSAGQRCTCARRLIVPAGPQGDAVLEAVLSLIDRLIVGPPFEDPAPFMGPVIGNAAADRLLRQAGALQAAGGKTLRPLTRLDPERSFLTPALIDVTGVADRGDEELFGPVLQLIRSQDFRAAIAEANQTAFGLAAGLVSDDETLYRQFWRETRAGIVNWNRPLTGASSAAPFGGAGLSGNHRPSAAYAADSCAFPVAGLEQPTLTGAAIAQGLR